MLPALAISFDVDTTKILEFAGKLVNRRYVYSKNMGVKKEKMNTNQKVWQFKSIAIEFVFTNKLFFPCIKY